MIHNEGQRRKSAECGVVPSISVAFSTSGLSLCVRMMINYPRAAFFLCANSAVSLAFGCYLPACTVLLLPNKSWFFWKRSAKMSLSGLKGPFTEQLQFSMCAILAEKKIQRSALAGKQRMHFKGII